MPAPIIAWLRASALLNKGCIKLFEIQSNRKKKLMSRGFVELLLRRSRKEMKKRPYGRITPNKRERFLGLRPLQDFFVSFVIFCNLRSSGKNSLSFSRSQTIMFQDVLHSNRTAVFRCVLVPARLAGWADPN